MAQVPTIDEPSVQETPGQEVQFQAPPQGAYPGAVGASIEAVGAEIGRIAHEEQQKAASDEAIQAETDYQNFVLDTHSKFTELHGEHALAAYGVAKSGLRDKRLEMAGELRSRTAQRLFMNSSLRTWRIYESQIDAHTAMERRSLGAKEKVGYLASTSALLANLANSKAGFRPADAKAQIDDLANKGQEAAVEAGIPPEAQADFVQKFMEPAIDSYMSNLVKGPNRALAPQEFEAYKSMMTPKAQSSFLGQIKTAQWKDQAAKILMDADRVSADPTIEADIDGRIDEDNMEKRISQAKNPDGSKMTPGQREELRHEVFRQLPEWTKEYEARVKDTSERIQAAGLKSGGTFVIDENASHDDLEWMRVHASTQLGLLRRQSRDNLGYELRGTTRSTKAASQMALLNQKDRFLHMKDDDPTKFAAVRQVDTLGLGMDPNDQQKLWSMIQREQKPDAVKLPGGSIRSQIIDKLDSVYEGDTGAKRHVRRYLLDKATEMKFKDQGEFNAWLDARFQESGTFFKSYRVEQEVKQAEAALRSASPIPPPSPRSTDQKSINLMRARKIKSDPLATPAHREWADKIFEFYKEKP